jgi:hypothetical protein
MVGSMNGGCWMIEVGKPASRRKAGEGEWIRGEPDVRFAGELAEGHPGVVHPVPPADHRLVADAIGNPDPRSPGVPLRVLERALSRTTRTAAREDDGPGDVAGARVGCRRVER